MQNTMQKESKEVAGIKETQLAIISSQLHLLNEVLCPQNGKKKFYTRLQNVPVEVIAQVFAWIPLRTVLPYRRLSKTINQCLLTREFALLNVRMSDSHKEFGMDQDWFHLPEPYQTVFASAVSGQLKDVKIRNNTSIETKPLPASITRLTAIENIILLIPDTISELTNLADLSISGNSFACEIPPVIWNMESLNMSK
ncbi:hypothetical protein BJ741DRAFT_573450 [Chytriomyces cf. hyalinus JEL632]|nr:hypothetical protein BJ741DRAFT_573450 [Chytriomyces cf. hyalinus JEL632]